MTETSGHSPSRQSNSPSANARIPTNSTVHCCAHKNPPVDSIPSQMNQVQIFISTPLRLALLLLLLFVFILLLLLSYLSQGSQHVLRRMSINTDTSEDRFVTVNVVKYQYKIHYTTLLSLPAYYCVKTFGPSCGRQQWPESEEH
jgi:hypothetical protein